MQKLLEYLSSLPTGSLSDTTNLEVLLSSCWNELGQSTDTHNMAGDKLIGRMESVVWEPPILSFIIERHGGTVGGSSRAELHGWSVNVETQVASCSIKGHRQLYPMEPRFDVKPIAEEVAQAILDHLSDTRLRWNKDGSVRISVNDILPSSCERTYVGRRKRLLCAVEERLFKVGWRKIRTNVYAPST